MEQISPARGRDADIAIDLGTANTLVVERGSGVVFDEPSLCCFASRDQNAAMIAAGREAQTLLGRVEQRFRMARPVRNGVLSDMEAGRELIRHAVRQTRGRWSLRKPRALISVPAEATQAERHALLTAARDAGLANAELLLEPLMGAVGAGLAVDEPRGRMIVDCGAGITEVAVISLGGVCVSSTVRAGGDTLDQALVDHLCHQKQFAIGLATAERLKREADGLLEADADAATELQVKGMNSVAGVPQMLAIPLSELAGVYDRHLEKVIGAVKDALGRTQPGLSEDILEDGVTLIGGAAMTGLLARRLTKQTGLKATIAPDPLRSVADGFAAFLG